MVKTISPLWRRVHRALHSNATTVMIGGKEIPVRIASNGCRYVSFKDNDLGDVTIMEQNKNKQSSYAARARGGEKLSWVMPINGLGWILIEEPVNSEL